MKILLMEYPMDWHHSQHMKPYLLSLGHEIDFFDNQKFNSYREEFTIPAKYDLVITGQPDAVVYLKKENPKTKVLLYCAEGYWSPGIMNPDYLITTFPEMIERYKKLNPEIFHYVGNRYKEFSLWIDLSKYDYNEPKTIKGISFMGVLEPLLGKREDRNGGGYFRLYREAYKERKDFIEKYKDLIHINPRDYSYKYIQWVCKTEANIPGFAYMAYFSKRPLENAAAGSINIFNIRDEYDEKYINQYGFEHLVNCIFVHNREDMELFYKLDEGVKQCLRKNAYDLVKELYTPEVVWSKILKWVDEN